MDGVCLMSKLIEPYARKVNNLAPDESILIPYCLLSVLLSPEKMNQCIYPSPFTNRATTPVYIGVSRGEGCSQNLHPTFTLRLYIFLLAYD